MADGEKYFQKFYREVGGLAASFAGGGSAAVPRPALRAPQNGVETPGRCRNRSYCWWGHSRQIIQVALGDPFVCPECASPLEAAVDEGSLVATVAGPSIAVLGSAAAGALTLALVLAYLHQGAPPPTVAAHPVIPPSCAGVPVTIPRMAGSAGPAASASATADADSDTGADATPPVPANDVILTDAPFSALPIAGGYPAYPPNLASVDANVSVDCLIQTDGMPANCKVLDLTGGQIFADAVQNWITSGKVRFAQIVVNGHAVAEQHHWILRFKP